jgi:hypothetical protein
VLGFYLRMEDMSSPQSETEWTDLFTGSLRTPPPLPSMGLGPSRARKVWDHTCQQDSGVSVEEWWR